MKKFRVTLASLFFSLLYMGNTTFASELSMKNDLVAKAKKHRHHESTSSDSSSSESSSSDSHRGRSGDRGHRGHRGHRGSRGHKGNNATTRGPQGAPGHQGSQGPQGPNGGQGTSISDTFISAAWVLPAAGTTPVVATNTAVPYNTIVGQSGNVSYALNSGLFVINETGHYEVTYTGKWTTATSMALSVNGSVIPFTGTLFEVTDDYATLSLILPITAGTTLQVIASGGGSMTFPLQGTAPSTHATITIRKIAN